MTGRRASSVKVQEKPQKTEACSTISAYVERCHNMKGFIIVFAGVLLFYGMQLSYTNSVLVSIERRFGLSTEQMGTVIAATEFGNIIVSTLVAHFGGKGHRPRWICLASILMGFSVLFFASPQIIFPVPEVPRNSNLTRNQNNFLCHDNKPISNMSSSCQETQKGTLGPVVVLGIAHVLLGIGSCVPMVLGMPYIDDNVHPKDVAIYFGIALVGRLLGPIIGYGLGAVCNLVYYDFSKPSFQPNDPRWISAWYLGFLVTGCGLLVFGVLMVCFPLNISMKTHRRKSMSVSASVSTLISDTEIESEQTHQTTPSVLSISVWKEFFGNFKRLLTNLAFVCRTSAIFIDGMILTGTFHLFPKYYTQQFQVSQFEATLQSGLAVTLAVMLGIVFGSFLIKKFRLEPRHVGFLMVIPSFIYALVLFIGLGMGCENTTIYGLSQFNENKSSSYESFCCLSSAQCGCQKEQFSPVCDPESSTSFYSPCHAGCTDVVMINATKHFIGCTCIDNLRKSTSQPSLFSGAVQAGLCPKRPICRSYLYGLTVLLFVGGFFSAIPLPGQVMIQFRIVDVDLKNLCAGVTMMISALGMLPAPICVGSIIDSTCRLWQPKGCGETGFCFLYDMDQYRWKFFLTGACIKLIAVALDSVVTWKVWNLRFEREEDVPKSATVFLSRKSI